MNLSVRPSVVEDILPIAKNIRLADARECLSGGLTPIQALGSGYVHSHQPMTAVSDDGTPQVMYGVVPFDTGTDVRGGLCWLLGTEDAITKGKWSFLRQSKKYLKELDKEYDVLFNFVDSRNTVHIEWLKWLGFKIIASTCAPSVDGTEYLKFVRIRPHV